MPSRNAFRKTRWEHARASRCLGGCLARREGQAREFQAVPAASTGNCYDRRSAKLAALFLVAEMEKLRIAQAGAEIELKNSMLAFDLDSRLINSSMASTVESGLKTLRSTHTRLNSSGGRSSSSLRVPER